MDSAGFGLNLPSIRITDRQGRLLYELLAQDGGRNAPTPIERIPVALRQATIATEDASFYTNPGVDPLGHPARRRGSTCRAAKRSRAAAPSPSRWRAACC